MLHTRLAPNFHAASKRFARCCLVAYLSLFIGNAWASPTQRVSGRLPGVAFHAPVVAALTASISASQLGAGTPSTTQSQVHLITNNGTGPETFHLSVVSRQSWTVDVTPTQVLIAPGASQTVTLHVTIPSDAPPGTLGLTTLTAANTPPAAPIVLHVRDTMLVTGAAALKIPAAQMGELVNGKRVYNLTEARGTTEFLPGLQTPTAGYNGSFLGPTLVMTKEESIALNVTNSLTEVTTTHWHGIHLPGQMDGGPHQEIDPGTTWHPSFTMINEASTAWYHPHPHAEESGATTGNQVYSGLAGMIIIRDSASGALGLPQRYGVDEFPIVV